MALSNKQRRVIKELLTKMRPDRMFNHTSVFSAQPSQTDFDLKTAVIIKNNYRVWFNSWIEEDLESLLS